MQEPMTYQNISTGETVSITGVDHVPSLMPGRTIVVYILSNDSRWEEMDFLRHHRELACV